MTKTSKFLGVTAGILVFSLAGCLNPITATPPGGSSLAGTPAGVQEIPDGDQPFTLMLEVTGKDGASTDGTDRFIAGLQPAGFQFPGTGVRNYIQLIVTDNKGDIVSFSDSRQETPEDIYATLTTIPLDIINTYNFLFLMGHWEKDYATGTYKDYDKDNSPLTLLAAAYTGYVELKAGQNTIPMTLYPITVDLEFTKAGKKLTPDQASGIPVFSFPWSDNFKLPLDMLPDKTPFMHDWGADSLIEVSCEIKKYGGTNGLQILLQSEGKEPDGTLTSSNPRIVTVPPNDASAADGRAHTNPNVLGRYIADGNISVSSAADGGSLYKLTWQMYPPAFALNSGNLGEGTELDTPADFQSYGANFNLDVYPFGKDAAGNWGEVLAPGGRINTIPKWIIRNGINNEKQNEQTTFNPTAAAPWDSTKNGNGAINFHRTMIMEYVAYYEPGKGVLKEWNKTNNTVTVSFQTIRDTKLEIQSPTTIFTSTIFSIPLAVYYAITPMIKNSLDAWEFPPAPQFDDYVLYEGGFSTTVNPPGLLEWIVANLNATNPCQISNKLTRTYEFNTYPFLNEEDEDEDAAICVWLIYFMNGALLNVPYAIASTSTSNGTTMYAGDVLKARKNEPPIYDYYE